MSKLELEWPRCLAKAEREEGKEKTQPADTPGRGASYAQWRDWRAQQDDCDGDRYWYRWPRKSKPDR